MAATAACPVIMVYPVPHSKRHDVPRFGQMPFSRKYVVGKLRSSEFPLLLRLHVTVEGK